MCVAATAATRHVMSCQGQVEMSGSQAADIFMWLLHVMSNPDKSDSVAFDSCAPPMPSGEILFIVHVMIPAR